MTLENFRIFISQEQHIEISIWRMTLLNRNFHSLLQLDSSSKYDFYENLHKDFARKITKVFSYLFQSDAERCGQKV